MESTDWSLAWRKLISSSVLGGFQGPRGDHRGEITGGEFTEGNHRGGNHRYPIKTCTLTHFIAWQCMLLWTFSYLKLNIIIIIMTNRGRGAECWKHTGVESRIKLGRFLLPSQGWLVFLLFRNWFCRSQADFAIGVDIVQFSLAETVPPAFLPNII